MTCDTGGTDRRNGNLAPAMALLFVSVLGISGASFAPSGKSGQYAVVAPPWFTIGETISLAHNAHDDIVDFGGLANIIVVHSDSRNAVRDLYGAGAWLVVDPLESRGCLGLRPNPSS